MNCFWHHLLRGDVEKIGEFQDEKIRSHGSNFLYHLLGAMSRKLAIFKQGKYVHMVPFYSHGSNFLASPLGGGVEEIGTFQGWKICSHGLIVFGKRGN